MAFCKCRRFLASSMTTGRRSQSRRPSRAVCGARAGRPEEAAVGERHLRRVQGHSRVGARSRCRPAASVKLLDPPDSWYRYAGRRMPSSRASRSPSRPAKARRDLTHKSSSTRSRAGAQSSGRAPLRRGERETVGTAIAGASGARPRHQRLTPLSQLPRPSNVRNA